MSDNFPEAKAVLSDEIANLRLVEINRSCLLINRNRSAAALEKVFTTTQDTTSFFGTKKDLKQIEYTKFP